MDSRDGVPAADGGARGEEAHIRRGLECHGKAEYEQALREFFSAAELNPANSGICLLIGNTYSCQGKHDLAERYYRESLRRNAANRAEAHFELGKIEEHRKRYRQAAEEYENALRCGYDPAVALRIIHLYKTAGDWEKAQRTARESRDRVPADDVFMRNLLLNELEIAQGKLVLESRPRSLILTLTNRCNLDCMMCEAKNLPWDIPEKTLEEAVACFPYLEHAMWQGGEVFLLDYFMDVFRESKKFPRMKQIIISNGMAFDEKMLEELATHPNLTLSLSVDAARKDELERIRKGLKMERFVENVRLLNELRRKHRSTMRLNVNVTVMRSNYRRLEEIVEFAGAHGFDFVFLTTVYGDVGDNENIFLAQDREALGYLAKSMGRIEQKARECGVVLHNWLPVKKEEAGGEAAGGAPGEEPARNEGFLCYAPWQRLYLDWKGNLFPDCMCLPDRAAGNLRDLTLSSFWNSEGMQRYRKKMRDRDYFDLCRPYCIAGRVEHLI